MIISPINFILLLHQGTHTHTDTVEMFVLVSRCRSLQVLLLSSWLTHNSHVQCSLTMSPARKVVIIGVWLTKILIIFLSLMGVFSILKQIGFISSSPGDRQVMEEVVEVVESRRERLYERRREVVREVCEDQEERITLHTVKMYDLVPPAPIGRPAWEQY